MKLQLYGTGPIRKTEVLAPRSLSSLNNQKPKEFNPKVLVHQNVG